MNYLIFIPSWSYRGGERIFLNLAYDLKEKGNLATVICGRKDEKNALDPMGVKIIYSKLLNQILQNNLTFFVFGWIAILVLALRESKKYDEVICESNQCLWAGALYSRIKGTRLTWYVMAYEEKHFNNFLLNFLYEISFGLVERICVRRVNNFYALAPRVKRAIDKKYSINSEVLVPIIRKVEVDYKKVPLNLKEIVKNKRILFLPAALHWKKNQKLAIKLTTKKKNIYLVLAGDGRDLQKLKDLSKKLKVDKRVYFCGVLNQNEMAFMYRNSYLTLVCSLNDNEGLSLTALESLLYGTPVLVSSKAGVAEVVRGRKNVYIAKPTVSDFSKSLEEIYNDY